ncbi:MAG: hypothetical protein ACI91Z_001165, partial [Yoonia sp.]
MSAKRTKPPYNKHEPTSAYLPKAAIRNSRSDRSIIHLS